MTRPDEDAAWRDIVEGYGERPDFPDLEVVAPTPAAEPAPAAFAEPAELSEASWADEGHFVPPAPPPVPRPRGLRAVAWFGLFGVPTLMLLLLLVNYTPPSPIGLLMIAWFVGGFGYLVATMNTSVDPDSGWDDGAVL
ncbi:MAG: hypothetical protein NTV23_05240 [Propionibacteriales bacterium]|nr:hypothetical protein [Propionibacteriales bacterium]